MKKVFEQKRGINYRRHTLYDDRIMVEMRSIRKIDKYEIRIEDVGDDIHFQADNKIPGKTMLVICLLVPVILTVVQYLQHDINAGILAINYVGWFGLALINFFTQYQDDIFLTGGEKNLAFYRNIPSEQAVLDFIEEIKTAAKNYTKNKYLHFDENTDEDEYYSRLMWLKDSEMITQEEFDEYKIDFEIKRLF